jgi:hypothetical protein
MKKLISLLLLGLFLLPINNTMVINTMDESLTTFNLGKGEVNENPDNTGENKFNVVENIAPYINQGVNSYYGRNRFVDFENLKVIDFKSLSEQNRSYEVILQITSSEPDGTGPYGVERVTVLNEFGDVKITNFVHVSTSQKNKKES